MAHRLVARSMMMALRRSNPNPNPQKVPTATVRTFCSSIGGGDNKITGPYWTRSKIFISAVTVLGVYYVYLVGRGFPADVENYGRREAVRRLRAKLFIEDATFWDDLKQKQEEQRERELYLFLKQDPRLQGLDEDKREEILAESMQYARELRARWENMLSSPSDQHELVQYNVKQVISSVVT